MKKYITLIMNLLACCFTARGQQYKNTQGTETPTITVRTVIPFEQTDEAEWIKRYQRDIDYYQKQNKRMKDLSCDVLFLGSSTINMWDTIEQDFAPLKIIRRSYGGATLRDMLYNYPVIAQGYQPKQIVLYVENDLGTHKEGVNAVKCFDLFRIFIARLKEEYPTATLWVVSLKPSPAKAHELKDQQLVNALLQQNAPLQGYTYLDITHVMYDEAGTLRTNIYKEDNLHMNAEGYKLWTSVLRPYLLKEEKE